MCRIGQMVSIFGSSGSTWEMHVMFTSKPALTRYPSHPRLKSRTWTEVAALGLLFCPKPGSAVMRAAA